MVKTSDFRDKILTGISIKYVWGECFHFALITVSDTEGNEKIFKVDGLLEFSAYDDLATMHISQVKIIKIKDQVYLSLDPYDELSDVADYERDNLWFQGAEVVVNE